VLHVFVHVVDGGYALSVAPIVPSTMYLKFLIITGTVGRLGRLI
jgi:hypothetical protein